MSNAIAVIGGSGFDIDACGDFARADVVETPYGECSAALQIYRSQAARELVFLPRHGAPHRIPPHRINYRANIWALHKYGCKQIIAINTVGSIGSDVAMGAIALPDQIIDYTYGREHTYSDNADSPLLHIDFTEPYSAVLRRTLISAAAAANINLLDGAVYGATQGPRLESAAEINRMQRDGCDIVGMTGMPEATLARELNLEYAALCLVVNLAAGRGGPLNVEEMQRVSAQGMQQITKVIAALRAG